MKIIDAGWEIIRPQNICDPEAKNAIYQIIESAGRTCYKSEDKITPESAAKFVRGIVKHGHEAMLEHASMTVKFVVDRGISHEIVRHRIASFAQESTRYCNYGSDKFGEEITVIKPYAFAKGSPECDTWFDSCIAAERAYMGLLSRGVAPEWARSVLPTCTKTEIVVTMNMREWRHFFKLRGAGVTGKPHPQMVEVAASLLRVVGTKMPELFGDILELIDK